MHSFSSSVPFGGEDVVDTHFILPSDTIVRETRALGGKMNIRNSFSEFDSYGSWVWTQHPQHVDFWHKADTLWIRYPEASLPNHCFGD